MKNRRITKSQEPRAKIKLTYLSLTTLFMLLFLFISCEQEEIIDFGSASSIEQQKYSKTKLSDEELINQINDLKSGTRRAYIKFNKNHLNHDFNKKFGKPLVKEIKYIKFSDDDNIIMILPLVKKNHKKKKILATYYKNGKKTYKVFTNKKYKKNSESFLKEIY